VICSSNVKLPFHTSPTSAALIKIQHTCSSFCTRTWEDYNLLKTYHPAC